MLEQEKLLGKIALKSEILTREQLRAALARQRERVPRMPLFAVLVEMGWLTDEDMEVLLAESQRVLALRAAAGRKKKKLRLSSRRPAAGAGNRRPARSPGPGSQGDGPMIPCRYCGRKVASGVRRCPGCNGNMQILSPSFREEEARRHSELACSNCSFPIFEDEASCPSCGAEFTPGDGEGAFQCSQCRAVLAGDETACPQCACRFL